MKHINYLDIFLCAIKMNGLYWVATLGLLAVTFGIPMPQAQTRSQGLVAGVFIPADAFKALQDKANANNGNGQQPNSNQIYQQTNQPQPNTNNYVPNTNIQTPQQNYQAVNTNPPQYANAYQPPNNQQVMTVQPQTTNGQPLVTDRIAGTNSNQPNGIMNNQSPQPSPQIIYMQPQPQPAPQTILIPQNSQPGQQQGYVLQSGQPNNLIVSNPSNVNPAPNSGTVYTLIPLNTQNSNSNSGSYLIPIQSANSNPIVMKSGN